MLDTHECRKRTVRMARYFSLLVIHWKAEKTFICTRKANNNSRKILLGHAFGILKFCIICGELLYNKYKVGIVIMDSKALLVNRCYPFRY